MVGTILKYFFDIGVPLAVAGAFFGTRWKEGFWGNSLAVFAVFFSSIIAVGWWESLAIVLSNRFPKMWFLWDFLVLWGLFLIPLLLIGEVTRSLSRVKVKFPEPLEKVGNGVALALITVLLLGFYYFSLDLAPLGEAADAQEPSPHTVQTQVLSLLSSGNLCSFADPKKFDADGNFRLNHFRRRQALMQNRLSREGSMMYDGGTIPPRRN